MDRESVLPKDNLVVIFASVGAIFEFAMVAVYADITLLHRDFKNFPSYQL